MGVAKYKYYFSKPKSEIAKDILFWIFATGAITIAATSPYFIQNVLRANQKLEKYPKRKIQDTFSSFRKRGLIEINRSNKQVYISLTKEGKKKAGILQINDLRIARPKKWDGMWRVLLFDIAHEKRSYREALRGKLKELNFFLFHKSVWVHTFDCKAEMEILRDFFGFDSQEMCLLVVESIEHDEKLREFFGV